MVTGGWAPCGAWGGAWGAGPAAGGWPEAGVRGGRAVRQLQGLRPRRWSWSPGSCPCSCPSWWTTTRSTWIRSSRPRRRPRSRTQTRCRRASPSTAAGVAGRALARGAARGLTALGCRFLQEQRMACEVGLYYVLHITKQRNKNALLRLLPGLGECAGVGRPRPPPQPAFPKSQCHLSQWARGPEPPKPLDQRESSPLRWRRGSWEPCCAHWRGPASQEGWGHPGALQEPAAG